MRESKASAEEQQSGLTAAHREATSTAEPISSSTPTTSVCPYHIPPAIAVPIFKHLTHFPPDLLHSPFPSLSHLPEQPRAQEWAFISSASPGYVRT